ncbi:YugN-like family protein [Jeotgalibacillus marinus]|uniref:YugN-like family protein n=1 Tax=Jeotgalibacillus marinus TaxID=86667 RepID=A0ABV3Q3U3_9BACL
MIEVKSSLKGFKTTLYKLETILKPLGFSIGGNWEYDHGYFDYPLSKEGSYVYVRIPFTAIEGELDRPGVVVELGTPFILGHQYQAGVDEEATVGTVTASFNQFQQPTDPDTEIPNEFEKEGRVIIQRVEQAIQEN